MSISYTCALLIFVAIHLIEAGLFYRFIWPKMKEINDNLKVLANNDVILSNLLRADK